MIKIIMTYKTTITNTSFWYNESQKTVKFMLDGLTKTEINRLTSDENTYQVNSINRSKHIANVTYNRMSVYSEELLEKFIQTDVTTSKIMVLISILSTDKLFYEYMNEVFKEHKLLGDKQVSHRELDKFMEHKKIENEKIANWSDDVISRIERAYFTFIRDSGLMDEDKNIKEVYIDYEVQKQLKDEGFEQFTDIIL